jgi:hypothetical protein
LLFNFASGHTIRSVYADVDNISGRSVNTVKVKADSLIVAIKEAGLDVNADKTKNIFMSGDRNAGRNHNMNTDSRTV